MRRAGLLNYGLEAFIAAKAVHTTVRAADCSWCPLLGWDGSEGTQQTMYLHLLAGRFAFRGLVASSEVESRATMGPPQRAWTQAAGWSETALEDMLAASVQRMADEFVIGKLAYADWTLDDMLAHGYMVGTRGSSSIARHQTIVVDGESLRPGHATKMLWMSSLMSRDVVRMLARHAEMYGRALMKLEPAALRLLLPGPVYHWLIESIALHGGDSAVYKQDPVIGLELKNYEELAAITNRLASLARGDSTLCSDYKDFNILHTYARMEKQWLQIAQSIETQVPLAERLSAGRLPELHTRHLPMAAYCCRWAAAALHRAWAKGGLPKEKFVQLVRGLWTGWRSTTFINTTMNVHYHAAINQTMKNIYGIEHHIKQRSVVGDDSEAVSSSEYASLRYLQLMDRMGLEASAPKQLASNSRIEYTRLMHSATGVVEGSLNRNIAGSTSSDLQSSPVESGLEASQALNEAMHSWRRRGGDAVAIEELRYHLLAYFTRLYFKSDNPGSPPRTVHVPQWIVRYPATHGGLGCARFGEEVEPVYGVLPPRLTLGLDTHPAVRQCVAQYPAHMSQLAIQHSGLPPGEWGRWKMIHASAVLAGTVPVRALRYARAAARRRDEEGLAACEEYRRIQQCGGSRGRRRCRGRADDVVPPSMSFTADKSANTALVRRCVPQMRGPTLLKEAVTGVVGIALDELAVAAREERLPPISHPNTLADVAVTIAAGSMAPVGARYVEKMARLSHCSMATWISRNAAASTANQLVELNTLFSPQVVQGLLQGRISLRGPTLGLLGQAHRVLAEYALASVLRRVCSHSLSGEELKLLANATYVALGQQAAKHRYWGPQQRY